MLIELAIRNDPLSGKSLFEETIERGQVLVIITTLYTFWKYMYHFLCYSYESCPLSIHVSYLFLTTDIWTQQYFLTFQIVLDSEESCRLIIFYLFHMFHQDRLLKY